MFLYSTVAVSLHVKEGSASVEFGEARFARRMGFMWFRKVFEQIESLGHWGFDEDRVTYLTV